MTARFAELTSPQVADLLTAQRRPVLLLPVGAVEPHGPHAPLCTDPLISEGMCTRAAELFAEDDTVRVLVLPTLPYGVTRFGAAFAGAVGVSEQTLHELVVDLCTSLVEQGFRHIVVVNNHFEPAHVGALRRAVETLFAAHGVLVGYLNLLRREQAARLTEEFRSGACHAGQYETSLVLADRPELVDAEVMAALPELRVDMASGIRAGCADFHALGMDRAYCGAPAQASAAEGASTFDTLTGMLAEVIRDVVTRG